MTNKEKTQIQKEIVSVLSLKPHGRLLLAPRVGKSKLAVDLIKLNKPDSILWATPQEELATTAIPLEFDLWKAKHYKKKLTTVTWMSLNKMKGHYSIIILDEEQFATENNLSTLLSGELTADYILSMTGTQTKHQDKLDLYKRLGLPVLYEMSINEAVDMGMLANYAIKVIEVDLGTEKTVPAGNKDNPFMTTEAAQFAYIDKTVNQAIYQKRRDSTFQILKRMRFIKNSPSKQEAALLLMERLSGRKLFFCGSIEQAESICSNTFHSKTDNTDLLKFMSGEVDEIAMVNAGGTGFTYKEIDHLVMTQADSDKNGLTSQKLCRTLLQQKDYKATIWIICLLGTQDVKWVESALTNFDKFKVEYIRFVNFKNII